MYKLFLTLRYLRKRRIAYFAIMAVALCVAMVLVVHSVMSGFLDTVRKSSRKLLGDVILEIGGMESFPFYDEFIGELKNEMSEDIVAATPVIINAGLLNLRGGLEMNRTALVLVTGIRLDEYLQINSFGEGLFYNTYYPGTTTFSEQRMPTWWWDEQEIPRLPDAYEQARKRYSQEHPGFEQEYARAPGMLYQGPGHFELSDHDLFAEPGKEQDHDYTGQPYPGIIIGIELVASRGADGEFRRWVPKGTLARLSVLPLTRSGAPTLEGAVTQPVRYVDDSRTKIYDIDSRTVYCDFDRLQRMLGLNARERIDLPGEMSRPRATQIQIKLRHGADYELARDQIERHWETFAKSVEDECSLEDVLLMQRGMQVMTWEQRNAPFIRAVEKESILMLILFAIISIVAVFLVGCIFYMIVQEKTREIGIVRSIGATSRGVGGIFVVYGFAIGVVGSAIGAAGGTLFVRYINEFQDLIARIHPELRVWDAQTYAFDRIPSEVDPFDTALIILIAIVASVVGSLLPARRAARVWPVDAIRYE